MGRVIAPKKNKKINMNGKRFTRHGKTLINEDAEIRKSMKKSISVYWQRSKAGQIRWNKKHSKK